MSVELRFVCGFVKVVVSQVSGPKHFLIQRAFASEVIEYSDLSGEGRFIVGVRFCSRLCRVRVPVGIFGRCSIFSAGFSLLFN